uniref:H15 domain-containing protein n=2 Tax=Clastoptera arizonana TaxID=38151 RepID=A0A1B6DFU8_9HEMI
MSNQNSLVQEVCAAVKKLRARKGADLEQILAHIQSNTSNQTLNISDVRVAVQKAVKNNLLSVKGGRYVLKGRYKDMSKLQLQCLVISGAKRPGGRGCRKYRSRKTRCNRAESSSCTRLKRILKKLASKKCGSSLKKKRTIRRCK